MNTQTTHECADARESIGQQLRSARIARGYNIADVASRLRVLASVVQDIERDDFSRLGAPIFVRGHLSSYCGLVGVAMPPIEDASGPDLATLPALRPMARTSRVQRAVEHSARSLVYVVLSASIGIPVIWFALNAPPSGAAPAAALTRLDPLPSAPAPSVAAPSRVETTTSASAPAPAADAAPPVVASLAGFYPPAARDAAAAQAVGVDAAAPDTGGSMVLHFRDRSWLEVKSPSGARLDEALVQPGEERRYPLPQVGYVTLGNAAGVDVNVDDTPVDIAPYRRANVARFKVSSDGQLAPSDG